MSWTPEANDPVYADSFYTLVHANEGTYIDNGVVASTTGSDNTVSFTDGDFFIGNILYDTTVIGSWTGSIDLTSYLPSTTAYYKLVVILVASTGTLSVVAGAEQATTEAMRVGDLTAETGCMLIRVRLQEGQNIPATPTAVVSDACRMEKNTYTPNQGGTGIVGIGTGDQVLRTNTGATALEYHSLVKGDVGLGNVDNVADVNQTSVGTIGVGTWEGDVITSAFLDTDTAHLTGTQTFTGAKTFSTTTTFADIIMSDASPRLLIKEDDATGNNGWWDVIADGEVLRFRVVNDADSTQNDFITVQRTGTTIDSVIIDGRTIDVDGTKLDTIENSATADQTQADINALSITTVGALSSGSIGGSFTAIGNSYIAGINQNLLTSSNPTFAGINVTSNIIPSVDDSDNLGSSANRFNNMYLNNLLFFYFTGTSTGTDLVVTSNQIFRKSSSELVKENFRDLEVDSSLIWDLPSPRNYNYIDTRAESFGWTAEEFDKLIPQVVNYHNNKPESIDYDRFMVLVFEETKLLKQRIVDLENR